jgi:formyl-CoA transferase
VRWPGPALGEHTDEVLAERAGVSAETLVTLRERGVI